MKALLLREDTMPDIGQTYIITHMHLVDDELMLVMEPIQLSAGIEINKEIFDEYMEEENEREII